MEAGNLECKNLRPVTPTEFHPLFVREGWLSSCKRNLSSFRIPFRPLSIPADRNSWCLIHTEYVYTLRVLTLTQVPLALKAEYEAIVKWFRKETRVDVCSSGLYTLCLFLFCCSQSCFKRKIGGEGRWRRAFFLFILFFKILIRSLDSILETEVKLKKKNLMFFGNLSTCW